MRSDSRIGVSREESVLDCQASQKRTSRARTPMVQYMVAVARS